MAAKRKTAGELAVAQIIEQMSEIGVEPDAKEAALLHLAREVIDHIAVLQGIIESEGRMQVTRTGVTRVHPALVEHRQQTLSLSKVLAQITIGDTGSGVQKNIAAQRSANVRWARRDLARAQQARQAGL
jgi:hypothetical protein